MRQHWQTLNEATTIMKFIFFHLSIIVTCTILVDGFQGVPKACEIRSSPVVTVSTSATLSQNVGELRNTRNLSSMGMSSFGHNKRNDDEDFDGYDDDDDDDDDIPKVDIRNFTPPPMLGRGGRSSPNQRKAMATKSSSSTNVHVCTNCGSEFVQWMGRCPTCRAWNTMQEFKVNRRTDPSSSSLRPIFGPSLSSSIWGDSHDQSFSPSSSSRGSWLGGDGSFDNVYDNRNAPVRVTDVYSQDQKDSDGTHEKRNTRLLVPNDDELNSVLGGGIMMGSLTLLGGDPGVGKSTLLLQVAGAVASLATPPVGIGMGPSLDAGSIGPVWYISGEENTQQIASRALRLGIHESELWLLSETHADTLCEQVVSSYQQSFDESTGANAVPGRPKPPSLLVIDSIQTMVCNSGGTSAAGGVTQVRECVGLFLRLAKSTGIPIFLVGHVTKNGDVAGPRTVEHMVDCVLYLEGGDHRTIGGVNLRLLRAAKNRFGSADELGVYEMTAGRLQPVTDPSSLLLSTRIDAEDSEGCAISIILEGLRAITVEIQALVTPGMEGKCSRTVNGIAYSRLQLLLGVLRKRCGMYFGKHDVYLNVVGNMRLDATQNEGSASDLAISVALVSSLLSIPVRSDTAFVGEVGLLGEIRSVPAVEKRLQEAQRMGFSRVVTSRAMIRGKKTSANRGKPTVSRFQGIDWLQCDNLVDALNEGLVSQLPQRRRQRKSKESIDRDSALFPGNLGELALDDAEDDDLFLGNDENDNENNDRSIFG